MLAVWYFKWIDTPCDKIFLLVLNLLTLTFDLLFKYNKIMNIKAYILHWADNIFLLVTIIVCLTLVIFGIGHYWGAFGFYEHISGEFFWLIHGFFFIVGGAVLTECDYLLAARMCYPCVQMSGIFSTWNTTDLDRLLICAAAADHFLRRMSI